ncbi:MAG TPA: hypothetical protein VH165_30535 [Kofleriaceae bacterium]|nr:hypothetical protein [Kofleriaceae bacterium]
MTITPAEDVPEAFGKRLAQAKLDETMQIYRTTMQYPLWSRPADGSNQHLTNWNHPISVGQPFAVDATKREIAANATIDRVYAPPGTPVTVQVTASHTDDGSPAPLDQPHAQLQWRDRANNTWISIQDIPLQSAAAGSWAGSVVPSQVAALRTQRETRMVAFVQVGEFSRELALDFAYSAQPPVVVHGIASERVVDGQLEVGLDADVSMLGTVGLNATLYGPDGKTAIAVYDDRYFPVRAGRQVIPVRFFGKILHDRQIDGPYHIGAVHGYVYQHDQPDTLFDRNDLPAMVTAAHGAGEFSGDPYHSPDVDAQLAQYQALRDGLGKDQAP